MLKCYFNHFHEQGTIGNALLLKCDPRTGMTTVKVKRGQFLLSDKSFISLHSAFYSVRYVHVFGKVT